MFSLAITFVFKNNDEIFLPHDNMPQVLLETSKLTASEVPVPTDNKAISFIFLLNTFLSSACDSAITLGLFAHIQPSQ